MPEDNFFARRRRELEKTQRDIALELEMTTGAVGAWENEIAAPRPSLATKLAVAYEVSEDRMLKEIGAIAKRIATKATAAAAK